jgi:hypothetical protein
MRSTITLLIGLSTVLLFASIYGIPYANGQASNPNNKTNNENSVSQTENLDPFLLKGSDNNINTGSADNPSHANDGSTSNNNDGTSQANDGSTDKNNNDGSTDKNNNDGSTDKNNNDASSNNNNHDNKKGSDNSKSSEDKRSKPNDIPFP